MNCSRGNSVQYRFCMKVVRLRSMNSCRDVMAPVLISVFSYGLLRDRRRSQIWCQNCQFADLFPLRGATQVGMIQHPKLGNDFSNQLSMTEEPYQRTFRDDNSHGFGNCAHVGGGDVTAAKSERHVHLRGYRIEVAARGEDNSFATHNEPTIQLRQFLDGSAKIEIGNVE